MKTLHLIRHAKSSWDSAGLSDHERPLNGRGIRSCAVMAQPIINVGCDFSNLFVSSALRAQMTIRLLSEALDEAPGESALNGGLVWRTDERLYTFDHRALLGWLGEMPADRESLVIVGHNPGLTDLTNFLSAVGSERQIENLPTCGYVQLVANSADVVWTKLTPGSFSLRHFLRPENGSAI